MGREFWNGLLHWAETRLIDEGMITREEFSRLKIVDSAEEALSVLYP
jgi:predicted Rossmann-fold nucleotide-binding protein